MVLTELLAAVGTLTNVEPFYTSVLTAGREYEWILIESPQLVAGLFAVTAEAILAVGGDGVVDVCELNVAGTRARNELFIIETGKKFGTENVGFVARRNIHLFLLFENQSAK